METFLLITNLFCGQGLCLSGEGDFNESAIYAPVVGYCSLWEILSLCATLDLEMAKLDIKAAFLYGEVSEAIYMEQSEVFVVAGTENL